MTLQKFLFPKAPAEAVEVTSLLCDAAGGTPELDSQRNGRNHQQRRLEGFPYPYHQQQRSILCQADQSKATAAPKVAICLRSSGNVLTENIR